MDIWTRASREPLHVTVGVASATEPPFITDHSRAIQLGLLDSDEARSEQVFVETMEFRGSPPWIRNAVCDIRGITLDRASPLEERLDERLVLRRYVIRVQVGTTIPDGVQVGRAFFYDGDNNEVLVLPVGASTAAGLLLSPKSLYATHQAGESLPEFNLLVISKSDGISVSVSPPPNQPISVRLIRNESRRFLFKVITNSLEKDVEAFLEVTTNSHHVTPVRVPIRVKRISGDTHEPLKLTPGTTPTASADATST